MGKLSLRLSKIAAHIPPKAIVADIGCDHGKVLLEALREKQAPFVFGSDISQKSVQKTQDLLTKHGYENFKTLQSDGLKSYEPQENKLLQCIVIAGMGGREILQILNHLQIEKQQFTCLKSLVLQPQNNTVMLREWLQQNNFHIVTDELLKEKNKFYSILTVLPFQTNKQKLNKQEILFGKTNLQTYNAYFESYLCGQMEKTKNIIMKASETNKPQYEQQLLQLKKIYKTVQVLKQAKAK